MLVDELAANPEPIIRSLLKSRNGAAIAKALEFARDVERGKLQRPRDVETRTTYLDELCCKLMDDVEAEQRRKDGLRAEVDALGRERRELERQRYERREAIQAEAAPHNLGWVDEGGDDGLAPAA